MKYLGKIEDAKSLVTKEYVDDAISNIGGGSGGSYDDSELREELSRKADVDGVYPEMTVGMTRDMLGVGEGDEGEFLFRPTDGDGSIKDGFASIEKMEGNSVVWNQLCISQHIQGSYDNTSGTGVGYWSTDCHVIYNTSINEHKVYACVIDRKNDVPYYYFTDNVQVNILNGTIFTANTTLLQYSGVHVRVPAGVNASWDIDCIFVDLTRMFGAGNEPSTVEEFYQRIPNVDLNAYNEGEVVNMNVQGIKSVGFNAWDEEWENGTFNITTGELVNNEATNLQVRSKHNIKILPNTEYYADLKKGTMWIMFFDKKGNIVQSPSSDYIAAGNSIVVDTLVPKFRTPHDAETMRFYLTSDYGTTYNHDICINLVHTGYRNGEYEPYVSDEIALPTKELFPNGMASINGVYDEYDANKMTKRIGVVDLGTLPWFRETGKDGAIIMISNGLANLAVRPIWSDEKANIICAKYQTYSAYEVVQNAIGASFNPSGDILIYDPAYTDTASFANAMRGVMLYYELAEPIVTTFDKPLSLDYQVWDFGTEEAIAEGKTTPLKASIVYEFNARDTIRKNRNDIAKLNEELLQLKTTIGTGPYVLNATILDLNRAIKYYEGEQNITDLAEIRNALVNHRTIHIKYGSNFDGYFVVSGYIDSVDMITLEFLFGLTHYSIDINPTTQIGNVSQYDIVQ